MLDTADLPQPQSYPPVESLAGRDAFVAATAIQIEHLQDTVSRLQDQVARLDTELETTRSLLSGLAETVEQNQRFQAFQNNERRLKELRLDELLRCWKEVKERLDRIEGTDRPVAVLRESTFPAVNRRITELAKAQQHLERAALDVRRNALVLFGGAVLVLAARELGWL